MAEWASTAEEGWRRCVGGAVLARLLLERLLRVLDLLGAHAGAEGRPSHAPGGRRLEVGEVLGVGAFVHVEDVLDRHDPGSGGVVVWWCGGVVVWWCGGVVWCVVGLCGPGPIIAV